MSWYRFFRRAFYIFFRLLFRWQVKGVSNIPNQGPVILCSNHISNLDPPLVGSGFFHRQVHFMAKEELFHIPVISFLIRRFGAFPIKRGMSDRKALKTALQILKNGEILGIFPEGTRSKTGELGPGLSGAALFALRSDAVVIPVAVIGPYRLFGKLTVVYGEPLDLSEFKKEKVSAEDLDQATNKIMGAIQNLLDKNR